MMRKVLRALERAFLAVFDAGDWVIDWLDHQSTAIILGLGMLLGVGATLIVAAIFASLRGAGRYNRRAASRAGGRPGLAAVITNVALPSRHRYQRHARENHAILANHSSIGAKVWDATPPTRVIGPASARWNDYVGTAATDDANPLGRPSCMRWSASTGSSGPSWRSTSRWYTGTLV